MNGLPPDVGDGSVCASFADDGSWLSLGTTDPDLGFVELSGMPPFPDAVAATLRRCAPIGC